MPVSQPANFDQYLAAQPPPVQQALLQIRQTIRAAVPEAEEIFSYKMPGFKMGEVKIWFAAYHNHIGMYPMYDMENFSEDLSSFRAKGTKNSLHFLLTRPIPLDLIEKIARFKFKV